MAKRRGRSATRRLPCRANPFIVPASRVASSNNSTKFRGVLQEKLCVLEFTKRRDIQAKYPVFKLLRLGQNLAVAIWRWFIRYLSREARFRCVIRQSSRPNIQHRENSATSSSQIEGRQERANTEIGWETKFDLPRHCLKPS